MKNTTPSICDRIVFAGLIFLLIFAPLAFGAVHVWAYTVVEVGVFLLLGLYLLDRLVFSGAGGLEWVRTPVNGLLLILLLLVVLQMVPLPAALVSLISPETYADKRQLMDVLEKAGSGGPSRWMTLAGYQHPVQVELIKLLAYFGMFFLVLNTARSKRRIDILVQVLILVGLFEAMYAIWQNFSDTPRVWWWKSRVGRAHYASGTFIVSNHFAGYMEMVLPLALGFVLAQGRRAKRVVSGFANARAAVQRLVGWFSPESASPKMLFYGFAAVIMGLGLLMSASRGGIISFGISMVVMAVLFFRNKYYRKYGLVIVLICLVMVGYGLNVGIDTTLKKFGRSEETLHKRLYTSESMLPMLRDYPVAGAGWGNFRYLYPRYVPEDYDGVYTSGYSHNDWLEAFVELGIPGALVITVAFGLFLARLMRVWNSRRDVYALGIGAGVMGALISIGLHSFFDFNMHIPANPLTLAALAAVGYVTLHRQGRGYSESFFYPVRRIFVSRAGRWAGAGLILAAVITATIFSTRHFLAEAVCATEWNSTMNLNWDPPPDDLGKAIKRNPNNAEYYFKLAVYRMSKKNADEAERKIFNDRAAAALEQAVSLNPARGLYWYHLGKRYSFRSYDSMSYLDKWLPLAETCFDTAVRTAPKDAAILFDVAWYWVWRSTLLPDDGKDPDEPGDRALIRSEGIRKFQGLFRRALMLDSKKWKQAAERVREYYPDNDGILYGIIPEDNDSLKSAVLKWAARQG